MPVTAEVEERGLEFYSSTDIEWEETDDAEFPYVASLEGYHLSIRVNDYPDEPLYTLIVEGAESGDFDDWFPNWNIRAKLVSHSA